MGLTPADPLPKTLRMPPTLLRFGQVLMLLVLFAASGGHWMVLQSVAWSRMLVSYSQEGKIVSAVAKTFDGRHPCSLCKQIEQAKKSDPQQEQATQTENSATFLAPVVVTVRTGSAATTAGTVTINSANTYSGLTSVSAGTLLVNNSSGSGTGSGAVSVNNGGTLGGTGTISGSVLVKAGSTISPGTGVGTITTGAANITGAATFAVDVNTVGGTADKWVINNGTATTSLGTAATLQLSITGFTPGSYVILDDTGTGALTGSFAGLTSTNGVASYDDGKLAYTLQYNYNAEGSGVGTGNDILLNVTSVPEPSSLALIGLGGLVTLKRRRRSKLTASM